MSTSITLNVSPDPGILQDLSSFSGVQGKVVSVQSGYDLLMQTTILWTIDNFFVGSVGEPFSEHTFQLHGADNGSDQLLNDINFTFRLFPQESPSGILTSLQCMSKKGDGIDENLIYAVEVTFPGKIYDKFQSSLTKVGERCEIFSISKTWMPVLLSNDKKDLVMEIAVTVLRKKPSLLTTAKVVTSEASANATATASLENTNDELVKSAGGYFNFCKGDFNRRVFILVFGSFLSCFILLFILYLSFR